MDATLIRANNQLTVCVTTGPAWVTATVARLVTVVFTVLVVVAARRQLQAAEICAAGALVGIPQDAVLAAALRTSRLFGDGQKIARELEVVSLEMSPFADELECIRQGGSCSPTGYGRRRF